MSKLAAAIATWFGCGFFPIAPGTVGSLAALGIAYLLAQYAHWRPLHFALLAVAMLPVAIWSAGVTARERNLKDPSIVVVDEVLGQWITLAGALSLNWKSWLAALAPLPAVRHLEAAAGSAFGSLAFRAGYCGR